MKCPTAVLPKSAPSASGAGNRRSTRGDACSRFRRLRVERLEARRVAAVDFVGSTAEELVVNLPDVDDARDDDTELRWSAGTLVVHSRNGEHDDASASLTGVARMTVNARAGDDLVTLDASLAAYSGRIVVNGGAGADVTRVGAGVRLNGVAATHSTAIALVGAGARLNLEAGATFDAVSGVAGTTIEASGDGVGLGNPASTTGFDTAGALIVGPYAVTLRDANAAVLGASTTLAGGTLAAAGGVSLSSGDVLSGWGVVAAAVDGNTGRIVASASGRTLTIGAVGSNSGVSGGDLRADAGATLVLLDANGAAVQHAAVDGRLVATTGLAIAAGKTLSGAGTIEAPTTVAGTLVPGSGGVGTLSIQGSLQLSGTAAYDIGGDGNAAYDRVVVTGTMTLSGATLSLARLGGFTPDASRLQSFLLIDNDGATDPVVGSFAGLPEGAATSLGGVPLWISYAGGDGNDVVLSTQPIVAGTAHADEFRVRYDGLAASVVRVGPTGEAAWTFAAPLPAALHVRAGGGADRVTVEDASVGGASTTKRWKLSVDGANVAAGATIAPDSEFDSLVIDSATPVVSDTGVTLITAAGLEVEYRRFEAVAPSRVATRVIDDGEPGFELAPGPAGWRATPDGFRGDSLAPISSGPQNAARWRFDSLPSGAYRVLATYPAGATRPAFASMQVFDGDRLVTTLRLDERPAPADDRWQDADWRALGIVPVESHELTFEATDATEAGARLAIDALRLDWAPTTGDASPADVFVGNAPAPTGAVRTIDDGTPGFTTSGDWSLDSLGAGGDSRRRSPGDASAAATWTFAGLAAGYYRVSATWPEKLWENSGQAGFAIESADGTTVATVDQRQPPRDRTAEGLAWQDLGEPVRVAADGGAIVASLRATQTSNLVVADSVRLERLAEAELGLVDVTDVPRALPARGATLDFGAAIVGEPARERTLELRNYGATPLALAGLTWPSGFQIVAPPADVIPAATAAGFGRTTLRLRLPTDVADAFRGELALTSGDQDEPRTVVTLVGVVAPSGDGTSFTGDAASPAELELVDDATGLVVSGPNARVTLGPIFSGETVSRSFTIRNVGAAPLTVSAPRPPLGYEVTTAPARVVAGGGRTSFTIGLRRDLPAGDYTGDLAVPNDDHDENSLRVRLSTRVVAPEWIVDDGDADFTSTGSFAAQTGVGYEGDQHLAPGGASGRAIWRFASLPAGVYQVAATWPDGPSPASASRTSRATYELSSGTSTRSLVVDQRRRPTDHAAEGTTWEEFAGGVQHAGGDLIVTLDATGADGYVAADAIRVVALAGPELQATLDGAVLPSRGATLSFPDTFIGDAGPTRALVLENIGGGELSLSASLDAPAGFRVASDTGETSLASGGRRTIVLKLDADPNGEGATGGAKSGAFEFRTNDADEPTFAARLTGFVETTLVVDQARPLFHVAGRVASYAASAGFRSVAGGYLGQSQYATSSAANSATFAISGLNAGWYQVSVTYAPKSAWATDAPFTLNGGAVIRVNQQTPPTSITDERFADQVASWRHLGAPIAIAPDGSVRVTLGGVAANKYVAADAIRVQWLGPAVAAPSTPTARLAASPAAASSAAGRSTSPISREASSSGSQDAAARDAVFRAAGLPELRQAARETSLAFGVATRRLRRGAGVRR